MQSNGGSRSGYDSDRRAGQRQKRQSGDESGRAARQRQRVSQPDHRSRSDNIDQGFASYNSLGAGRSGSGAGRFASGAARAANPHSRAAYERDLAGAGQGQHHNARNDYSRHSAAGAAGGYVPQSRYSAHSNYRGAVKRHSFKGPLIALAALLLAALAVYYVINLTVSVTINGVDYKVGGGKTLADAWSAASSDLSVEAGDYVDVEGVVLQSGGGREYSATINGSAVDDAATKLTSGDSIVFGDGADVVEQCTGSIVRTDPTVSQQGTGSLHVFTGTGAQGIDIVMNGSESGKSVTKQVIPAGDIVCLYYNADTGDDKVVALTFDDGPSQYTQEVLDILEQYGAKATFFTIGENVENYPDELEATVAAGHQVCTHTYDHADGSGKGVNLGYMTAEEQIEEIEKGYEAIEAVTGTEVSTVIRVPGGNFSEETMQILRPYITAEIGWNIDTEDWQKPGAESIASAIASADPGDVILCHDGGGDREQTVEALRIALPQLVEKGYTFVTIDELLAYGIPTDE